MQNPEENTETPKEEQISDNLRASLELLVERDNPMADAAENALEVL